VLPLFPEPSLNNRRSFPLRLRCLPILADERRFLLWACRACVMGAGSRYLLPGSSSYAVESLGLAPLPSRPRGMD
jgi:hypothetical protein